MRMRSLFYFSVWVLACAGVPILAQVEITEFLAVGGESLTDQDGEASDWIELHNATDQPVSLAGWTLTDSQDPESGWSLPAKELAPDAYLIVFASGKDRSDPDNQLHANFNLDGGGEYLALIRPDGSPATVWDPAFPPQREGFSHGFDANGDARYFDANTPGAANGEGFIDFVEDTQFSVDRGFFEQPFQVEITSATPDAVIRYTLDGTEPAETTGELYAGPIAIDGTTILRAAAFKENYHPTNVDTQTYLFLEDVIRQSPNGEPPPGWPNNWGSNVTDYGMDPQVVDNPAYRDRIIESLKSIPTFSLVTDINNLFSARSGIYANASLRGSRAERPASVELMFPDEREGFQVNAGIRIRGGFSRSTDNPKHAFRVFFRRDYGPPKLRYPLFGEDAAQEFDGFDLRTFQNYSWSFQGDSQGIFVRDAVNRDLQLAMGHPGERGDFYHLYINGQYWGLFNTDERPEASFGESYFGGDKEEYDVIKVDPTAGYNIEVTDGNINAWRDLFTLTSRNPDLEDYLRIQGLNPDGTRNPEYPVLLDVPNLIDYMMIIFYGGNLDAPVSWFLSNSSPNNYFALRNRNGEEGFRFFVHDAEHTLLLGRLFEDRTGPFPAGSILSKSNPQYMFQELKDVEEFRIRVSDHIHRHFFNDGLLTPQTVTNLFLKRIQEIDSAVIAESARWGDSKRGAPLTRDGHWEPQVRSLLNSYFPMRTGIVLDQLIGDGWYPAITAPAFNQHGGKVPPDFELTMSAPQGDVYYTLDGSDPRQFGGEINPDARRYSRFIRLNSTGDVKARALVNGEWSALNAARFIIIRTFQDIVVTELMYHPMEADAPEFIELKNTAAQPLDLGGAEFVDGIQFTFPQGFMIDPGQRIVLTQDAEAFRQIYPDTPIAGVYEGRLSNDGERLKLQHAAGGIIFSFEFGDDGAWPATADGLGFSMEYSNPADNSMLGNPNAWQSSSARGGSPGMENPPSDRPSIRITEILSSSSDPADNALEIFNAGDESVDLGHWWISDSKNVPNKFRIPEGVSLEPGGFLVVHETELFAHSNPELAFGLRESGEAVFLFASDAEGRLTGYSHGVEFPATDAGKSAGLHVTSQGRDHYPMLAEPTLGQSNAPPLTGPVVISEIHYSPVNGLPEFLELQNISDGEIPLFEPGEVSVPWRLEGVQFEFPPDWTLAPGEFIVITNDDPERTRAAYNVPHSIRILGPYGGALDNDGELVQLQRPRKDFYYPVDSVRYDDRAPWPEEALLTGYSLERIDSSAYGDDPANWRFSPGTPSPGLDNHGNRPPHITLAAASLRVDADEFPARVELSADFIDDGLPNPPGETSVQWRAVNPPAPAIIQNAGQSQAEALIYGAGTYVFSFIADDGEYRSEAEVTVHVDRLPSLRVETALPFETDWKYLDDGSNQGTAWRGLSFNDSAWETGPAPLGYDAPNLNTVLSFGDDPADKHITTYFRTEWNVDDPGAIQALQLEFDPNDLSFDAGGGGRAFHTATAVYLNGFEVFRSNFSPNVQTLTYRTSSEPGYAEAGNIDAFIKGGIPLNRIREGRNVIALEAHRVNLYQLFNTDDLFAFFRDCCEAPAAEVEQVVNAWHGNPLTFKMKLEAEINSENTAPLVEAGETVQSTRLSNIPLSAIVMDDGLPDPPGRLAFQWELLEGPGEAAFADAHLPATTVDVTLPGAYLLRFTANDGASSVSAEFTLNVQEEGEAFEQWLSQFFDENEIVDPDVAGPGADPDGDGLNNRQEHTAGTHPKSVDSVLAIRNLLLSATPGSEPALLIKTVPGKLYHIEYKNSLEDETWIRAQSFNANTEETSVNVSGNNGGNERFYRVVVDAH